MGTARDFHVKAGLVVDSGNVTLTNGNLVLSSGQANIDNITINANTISSTNTNGAINLTPHGTGSVAISKVDIDAGTIDGATIATSDITVGTGKTLDVSGGTLTLANDQISGDAVSGGTIDTTTITALAGDLSLGDNSITNVGDIALDSISADGNDIDITLTDNRAASLEIKQGSNVYMAFNTADTNGELIELGKDLQFEGTANHKISIEPTSGTNQTGRDLTFEAGTSTGNVLGGEMVFKVGGAAGSSGTTATTLTTALTLTGAGVATIPNVDINGGTIDSITSLTASGDLDIGAHDFRAATLTADGLTSGRVVFAGTNGVLSDDSDLTFSGDTLTATKVIGSTSFTVGTTVITDDSIVMTPSSGDTLSITSAANGESTIATVDASGSLAAHLHLDADGAINLKFNSNTKLATATDGIDVTGNASLTGSIDSVTNVTASGFIHSGHARMRESTGVLDAADVAGSSSGTHKIIDIDGTNFYTSETISVTEVSGRVKQPSTDGSGVTFGTNANNVGCVSILGLAVGDTGTASNSSTIDIFQAAEAFCVATIKNASNVIQKRVVNKVYGLVNAQGAIETIVEHESGDVELGRFVWMKHEDGAGVTEDTMVLVFQYTSKYTHTSNDITTYSVNVNGLSIGGAGG